ncbi:DUF349 domain-containing protein [Aquimarina sp. ERC-38]|uniref:DUF349 domain-containing protein n=1 Tax=Aquimarina sp. ERC-38 TaxID=2949996 RepID=UPI002246C646|nr:DUF349 domain-containing protein [Aquimarina sp. ERC-38]UZO80465.1 DUF349 domain-containing protein [Aquimarina sp. ERC-38]
MSVNDNLPKADGTENKTTEEATTSSTHINATDINASAENTVAQAMVEEAATVSEKQENTTIPKTDNLESSVVESIVSSENTGTSILSEDSTTENFSAESATSTNAEETPEVSGNQPKENSTVKEIDIVKKETSEEPKKEEPKEIEKKDYASLTKEELVKELKSLIKNEEVQRIKEHVEEIKTVLNTKFNEEEAQKKEEFLAEGGNIIDFYYSTPIKKEFNATYFNYREKRNNYYQNIKRDQQENLKKRLELIEELKNLPETAPDTNTAYKQFKEIKEKWHNAGAIPKDTNNTVWNTYYHHTENFYSYLHLNRDFRELDYKYNLEQKLKVIERATELAQESNVNRAFRELQSLHKVWKEELGPVSREYSDQIWEKFSDLTKKIHDNRQRYFEEQDKIYEKNLEVKHDIIRQINEINRQEVKGHGDWQKSVKKVEALREDFFKAGKVPLQENEATWQAFKSATKTFNTSKNSFYKSLKTDQLTNLEKKKELIKIAEDNKDNEDLETTTALMKKIQADWKKIGHVPRKDSDRIWKQFKDACNAFFDRIHEEKNAVNKEEEEALLKKEAHLETVKKLELTGDNKTDLQTIKDHISTWKSLGRVPYKKKNIEQAFNKALDALFSKLDLNREEAEMIKFQNKMETLKSDDRALQNEKNFIKKKIDEVQSEITQLENNLQFFKHAKDDNPLVKEVKNNINKQKENLEVWKNKFRQLKQIT